VQLGAVDFIAANDIEIYAFEVSAIASPNA
jgi:hypothetical protein